MHVRVRFFGPIERHGHGEECSLELPSGSTVQDALARLGYPQHQYRFITTLVSGSARDKTAPLSDGETLDLALPMSGG